MGCHFGDIQHAGSPVYMQAESRGVFHQDTTWTLL
jgi:hypothetical protein